MPDRLNVAALRMQQDPTCFDDADFGIALADEMSQATEFAVAVAAQEAADLDEWRGYWTDAIDVARRLPTSSSTERHRLRVALALFDRRVGGQVFPVEIEWSPGLLLSDSR